MRIASAALVLLASLCTPVLSSAQEMRSSGPGRAEIIVAAKEVMRNARFCDFITLDAAGAPQARVVDPFAPEDDMTVLLGTNASTRKVAQVNKDARVALLCAASGSGYVTLLGKAEIVRDKAAKERYWKEEWKQFYQDANHGDDYVLIRIRPSRLEIVSFPHQIMNDPKTWKPVTLEFQ